MTVRIGTSGWSYVHWEGVLYPAARPRERLAHYLQEFSTVELNSSFYRWPRDAGFARWRQQVPPGFAFSAKAPRGLTHGKKLFQPDVWIERIQAGWHELGDRREVLLVQLAPSMERDDARLEYFLSRLPDWIQVAVEFRARSWLDDEVFSLLERYGAAYCVMSGAGLPCVLRATAPLVYVRLHGPDTDYLYGGSYSDTDLHWWADRCREWRRSGRKVLAYFNNDGGGNAVRNARLLRDLVER